MSTPEYSLGSSVPECTLVSAPQQQDHATMKVAMQPNAARCVPPASSLRSRGFEAHSWTAGLPSMTGIGPHRSALPNSVSQHRLTGPRAERTRVFRPPPLPALSDDRAGWRQSLSLPPWSLPRVGQEERRAELHPCQRGHGNSLGSSSSTAAYATHDTLPASSLLTSEAVPGGARLVSLPPPLLSLTDGRENAGPERWYRPRANTQSQAPRSTSWPSAPVYHPYDEGSRGQRNEPGESGMMQYERPLNARGHAGIPSSIFRGRGSPSTDSHQQLRRVGKVNVTCACLSCRRAHLACDAELRLVSGRRVVSPVSPSPAPRA